MPYLFPIIIEELKNYDIQPFELDEKCENNELFFSSNSFVPSSGDDIINVYSCVNFKTMKCNHRQQMTKYYKSSIKSFPELIDIIWSIFNNICLSKLSELSELPKYELSNSIDIHYFNTSKSLCIEFKKICLMCDYCPEKNKILNLHKNKLKDSIESNSCDYSIYYLTL